VIFRIFFFFFTAAAIHAQSLSVGLIGGGSLTDAVHDTTTSGGSNYPGLRNWSQHKDWIAGAAIELQVRPSFSVEVDGMYRTLHSTWAAVLPDGTLNSVSPSPVVTWEFPVLAKYRFFRKRFAPFVEAGPAFRTTGNLNFSPSHVGAAAGLGVEAQWHGILLAPVARYTRWLPDSNLYNGPNLSQLNQVELLLSVSHKAESTWNPAGRRLSLGAVVGWGLSADIPYSNTTTFPDVFWGVNVTSSGKGITSSIAGPSAEVHFNPNWSVEVDALHKPLRGRTETSTDARPEPVTSTWTEATTWQFPLLAKYRLHGGRVEPLFEAGPSFRLPQYELATHGFTAGVGVQMRAGALKIAPAFRFTRWGAEDRGASYYRRNEASLVVGLSFGGPKTQ
jgi:hypothetical protein